MLAFLSARARAFVFFVIVLPLIGFGVRKIARLVESRTGRSSTLTRTLDRAADFSSRRGR